jgi:Family of unknown function (DUF5990)
MDSIRIRLIYDGTGPITWSRQPGGFGLQDKAGVLHLGAAGPSGTVVFNLSLQLKPGSAGAPVVTGPFAHGPSTGRFLYLGWRNAQGGFAQRLKLPLGGISWTDIGDSIGRQEPLVGILVDRHPRVTSSGANIGGSRPISWALP